MTKTHFWGHRVWISDGLAYTRHNIHSFVKATQLKRNSTEWMRDVKVSGVGCSGAAIPERLPPPPSSEYNLYSASSASHLLAPPLRPGRRVGLQTVSLKSSSLPTAIGWEGRREQDVFFHGSPVLAGTCRGHGFPVLFRVDHGQVRSGS